MPIEISKTRKDKQSHMWTLNELNSQNQRVEWWLSRAGRGGWCGNGERLVKVYKLSVIR